MTTHDTAAPGAAVPAAVPAPALAALFMALLTAACATARGDAAAVSPAVLDALRAGDSVRVLVALVPPDGAGAAVDRAEIARRQDAVLATLDPADFRLRHRFTAVPAFTGTLLTERGARALAAHRYVERVGPDEGGGQGGAP